MTDKYAVVGNPIAHSKSPMIHRLFAEQTGQDISYEAILIDNEETTFQWAIADLRQRGYKGLNVTVPFKLDAFELANELSSRAQSAHAVNTLVFQDNGTIYGDNTDGVGLVNDIQINGERSFKDQRVLILGAGGAVQGIMEPLLAQAPKSVHIANRTAKRAEVLGQRFTTEIPISGSGWDEIPLDEGYDIIINGTSASLDGKLPPVSPQCLKDNSLVYDMMYAQEPTVFLKWAKEHRPDCTIMDGLGMLVGQAAESFNIWRGVQPQTQNVIDEVRQQMSK
ncbi:MULTISPECIES: shikimate dehydrogenase [Thiomicrorhabdus]|uniref:Shikimate dehydrogenase (NADP(+)) n=1 Tax=Thiomicrorhabdus heinhorstiae TaxID=2748010 RepID=A0ABS0BZ57_9GAMM|nr:MULTISPECIES: shikimate dehydrogenase [Thiomicrorhabdus]MBF6059083.1 shikimate dehydrogenase [Thiomicrorhabdus heinhorstiae]